MSSGDGNPYTMDIDTLKRRCEELYKGLSPEELITKFDMLQIASDPESIMYLLSPSPEYYFPINLYYTNDNVRRFLHWWLQGGWKDNIDHFYMALKINRVIKDTPENERNYYATIYKVLMTPLDARWVPRIDIDDEEYLEDLEKFEKKCNTMYKKLNYKERKSKYEMLVIASDPKSLMNVLPPPNNFFPVNLDLSDENKTIEHHACVNNFMLQWLKGKPADTLSLFYTDLVKNRAFEDTLENKKIYYVTIYKVLISPSDAVSIGGKRRINRKTKRRKRKTRRMRRSRRSTKRG